MIPKDSNIALPLAYHHLDEFSLVVTSDQADGTASSVNKVRSILLYMHILTLALELFRRVVPTTVGEQE